MTHRPLVLTALAALALAGGAAAWTSSSPAHAQEKPAGTKPAPREAARETVRDTVERLLPDLLSEQESVRDRASRAIVALGDPAKAELDRLTRDPDPQKAIAALKMLQSDAWDRAAREQKAEREGEGPRLPAIPIPKIDIDQWQRDVERQFEDMRKRMREWEKQFDVRDWVPGLEEKGGGAARTQSSGSVTEDGRSFSWSIDATGRVKVTTKDGPDAPETTVEAPDMDALRRDHPEVAKRLEEYAPQSGTRRWVFRWPPRAFQAPASPSEDTGPLLREGEERLRPFDGAPVPGPLLGVGVGDVPEVLRDQLDLPEGGIVVESVTPNSLAERLGLRRNDVLLRIGDQPVAAAPDVRKALEAVPDGGTVKVEIVRKGRRETLSAAR
jgi:hypothetical protein